MPRTVRDRYLHGGTTLSPRIASISLVVSAFVAAGCGASSVAPDPVPADALPGDVSEMVRLDAGSVAGDAIDVEQLGALLEDAGFEGGTQRLFSQREGIRRQRSLARVLTFGDTTGALTYLRWLEGHIDEVIGTAELLDAPNVGEKAFLALSEPGDCCPKATDVYFAAWVKGARVLTLEVGGDGIEPADVQALAATLDGAVTP